MVFVWLLFLLLNFSNTKIYMQFWLYIAYNTCKKIFNDNFFGSSHCFWHLFQFDQCILFNGSFNCIPIFWNHYKINYKIHMNEWVDYLHWTHMFWFIFTECIFTFTTKSFNLDQCFFFGLFKTTGFLFSCFLNLLTKNYIYNFFVWTLKYVFLLTFSAAFFSAIKSCWMPCVWLAIVFVSSLNWI